MTRAVELMLKQSSVLATNSSSVLATNSSSVLQANGSAQFRLCYSCAQGPREPRQLFLLPQEQCLILLECRCCRIRICRLEEAIHAKLDFVLIDKLCLQQAGTRRPRHTSVPASAWDAANDTGRGGSMRRQHAETAAGRALTTWP